MVLEHLEQSGVEDKFIWSQIQRVG